MALDHSDFEKYPLVIAGISASEGSGESIVYLYDSYIGEIEDYVVSEMAYVGSVDIDAVLPYFVFFKICQDLQTTVTINAGENVKLDKLSEPSIDAQVRNWNTGVDKLRALLGITPAVLDAQIGLFECHKIHSLVESSGLVINEHYLNKIRLI